MCAVLQCLRETSTEGLVAARAVRHTWLPVPLQWQALVRRRAGLDEQALGIPALPAVINSARIVGGLRVAELNVPQVPGVHIPSVAQACFSCLLFGYMCHARLPCLFYHWRSKRCRKLPAARWAAS